MRQYHRFSTSLSVLLLGGFAGLLSLLIGIFHPSIAATTYYVAPDVQNGYPSSISQPLLTLSAAISRAEPGDTVILRGGVYQLQHSIWVGVSGAANAPITIKAYLNETPILDGRNLSEGESCIAVGGRYIALEGIECAFAPGAGIVVWCGQAINIRNNTVHDAVRTGIFAGCDRANAAQNIRVEGNTVYHNAAKNQARATNGGWDTGISVLGGSDIVFANNTVYENYGEGIGCFASLRCHILQNEVHDNYSVEIYIANSSDVIVERNFIYNTHNSNFFRKINYVWQPAVGIQLGDEGCYDDRPVFLNRIVIKNNIVISGGSGFYYGNYICPEQGMKDVTLANNTFYEATDTLLRIEASLGSQNNTVANNIFYQSHHRPIAVIEDTVSVTYSHNLWYGGEAGAASSQFDVNADPNFVNPGATEAAAYQLKADSKAIDQGMVIKNIADDYWGHPRPLGSGYDIGAMEAFR